MDPMVGGAEVQRSALLVGAAGAAYDGGSGKLSGGPGRLSEECTRDCSTLWMPRNCTGDCSTLCGVRRGCCWPVGPPCCLLARWVGPSFALPFGTPLVTPSRLVAAGVRQRRALRFRSCREGCLLAMRSTSLRPADPTELSRLSRRSPAPSGLTAAGAGRRCASAPLGGWPFGEFCGPYPLCCSCCHACLACMPSCEPIPPLCLFGE